MTAFDKHTTKYRQQEKVESQTVGKGGVIGIHQLTCWKKRIQLPAETCF
jgi:hypothetical protein